MLTSFGEEEGRAKKNKCDKLITLRLWNNLFSPGRCVSVRTCDRSAAGSGFEATHERTPTDELKNKSIFYANGRKESKKSCGRGGEIPVRPICKCRSARFNTFARARALRVDFICGISDETVRAAAAGAPSTRTSTARSLPPLIKSMRT